MNCPNCGSVMVPEREDLMPIQLFLCACGFRWIKDMTTNRHRHWQERWKEANKGEDESRKSN